MLNPKVWGPKAWFFLHSVTLSYPTKPTEEDKRWFRLFFESLKHVLPCDSCRKHYHQNLQKQPLTEKALSSKEQLVRWLIDLHNEVNKMTHKPILSYDDVFREYTKAYRLPSKGQKKNTQNRSSSPLKITMIHFSIILTLMVLLLVGWLAISRPREE